MLHQVARRGVWFAVAATVLVLVNGPAAPSALAAVTIGHPDASIGPKFGQFDPPPPKPEHRLWYAANSWWGIMPSGTSTGYTIWQLGPSGSWSDTGVVIDRRSNSGADALFNGKHLYVATHQFTPTYTTSTRAPATLLRFTFNGRSWAPDRGFPVPLTNVSMPAISIGQDSTGRILAAYVSSAHPWFVVTENDTDNDELPVTFGAPIKLTWEGTAPDPDAAATLTGDDIAAVNSSNGFTTIVWSNQSHDPAHNGFYAARHRDATAFRTANWTAVAVTPPGANSADNHIALTAIPGDPKARIFAVLKTSKNDPVRKIASEPQLQFSVFTPTDPEDLIKGSWKTIRLTTVSQGGTRPAVVIDRTLNRARVFYAAPYDAATITDKHNQGVIFEKQVDYERLVTPVSRGVVVQREGRDMLDDPTTTSQNTDAASGTVVEAYTRRTQSGAPGRLWHSGAPGAATFGAAAGAIQSTPSESALAFPALPATPASAAPTFGSRSKDLATRVWSVASGTPGRYVALAVAVLLLLIPVVVSARRRSARRRRRAARQRYGYY